MEKEKLAAQLFFSKEAAEYLGITVQRLNKLVQDGKVIPLKKNSSGTIFHIDELNRRKEEVEIFTKIGYGGEKAMFVFDTKEKQEALNYATLMNVLNFTEHKLEPLFEKFSQTNNVSLPLDALEISENYVEFFKVDSRKLFDEYYKAQKAFSLLRDTDEIIKRGSQDYPPLLSDTQQAPRFLYLRGKKSLLFEKRTVALVGSRNASEKAKENTVRVAEVLGKNGVTVISGLAKGIDVTAHKTALKKGYNTIAVIGTNLNQYYPKENKEVQIEIEKKGLVVSQFSPANKTQRWFFPLRNGVMSGLSLATVIMEAGETSGALKQADFALKQGRQILIPATALQIPTISWPQKYVNKGAEVVNNPKDIIDKLTKSNIFKSGEVERYEQQNLNNFLEAMQQNEPPEKRQFSGTVLMGE